MCCYLNSEKQNKGDQKYKELQESGRDVTVLWKVNKHINKLKQEDNH